MGSMEKEKSMNDLEERLLEAIYKGVSLRKLDKVPEKSFNWFRATADGDVYEFVIDPEPIKGAFKDAGWLPVVVLNREQSYMVTGDKIYRTATLRTEDEWKARNEGKLMTGQEWYDRFVKELEKIGAKDKIRSMNGIIVKNAAKRASVLERE